MALLALACLAVVFGLATFTRADADLWGHLRFGLDTLRDRALTFIDPYSFTQDKAWVNHEWLSELMMALAYRAGNVAGLVVLKATMLTAVVAIVWRGLAGASHVARISIIVGLAFGTIHISASIRPQVWTLLAVALLCRTLVRDRPRERRWLPVLFAIWVNCHGGWIVGLGVLGVWAAVDTFVRPARLVEWLFPVGASIVATFVNPYGWGLWLFIAETVRMTRNITEWGPLWGTPFLNWIPWILSTVGVGWFLRRSSPLQWPTVAVLAMLSYSALRVMRVESIFVTATVILLGPAIRERWPARVTPLTSLVGQYSRLFAVLIVVGLLSAGFRTSFRSLSCIGMWSATRPDQFALPSLLAAEPGRIVTFFDWGKYALWHLGPRLRVSMDGRRETVYSDARLEQHAAILDGNDAGLKQLSDWQAEYVWLPKSSQKTADWLRANGYRIDVETERSFVAVRSDLPRLPAPRLGSEPACFPG